MHFPTPLLALLASAALTNAAVVHFFSDDACVTAAGSRNVYDNTVCAATGGFKSFKITTAGGSGQTIATYSSNGCVGTIDTVAATEVGVCYSSTNSDGGSNSIASYA